MTFLSVNDLLPVCIVQNHQNSPLYIIKKMFSLKINKKIAVGKVCLLAVEEFGSLVPCFKTENDIKNDIILCLSTWVIWCTFWLGISPI